MILQNEINELTDDEYSLLIYLFCKDHPEKEQFVKSVRKEYIAKQIHLKMPTFTSKGREVALQLIQKLMHKKIVD